MKTPKIIKKLSTLYKSERLNNVVKFNSQRDEFIKAFVGNRTPKFNVKLTLTDKPF